MPIWSAWCSWLGCGSCIAVPRVIARSEVAMRLLLAVVLVLLAAVLLLPAVASILLTVAVFFAGSR